MNEGDFLRHKARPEWGIGEVRQRRGDRIDVDFSQHGLVPFKLSVASVFLESVSKAEAALAGVATPRRQGPAKTAAGSRKPRTTRAHQSPVENRSDGEG